MPSRATVSKPRSLSNCTLLRERLATVMCYTSFRTGQLSFLTTLFEFKEFEYRSIGSRLTQPMPVTSPDEKCGVAWEGKSDKTFRLFTLIAGGFRTTGSRQFEEVQHQHINSRVYRLVLDYSNIHLRQNAQLTVFNITLHKSELTNANKETKVV